MFELCEKFALSPRPSFEAGGPWHGPLIVQVQERIREVVGGLNFYEKHNIKIDMERVIKCL